MYVYIISFPEILKYNMTKIEVDNKFCYNRGNYAAFEKDLMDEN